MRDRFVDLEREPGHHLWRALAELTVANEFDVLQHAALTTQQRLGILALLRGCEALLSPAARAALESHD
jgi:hypothetical protein